MYRSRWKIIGKIVRYIALSNEICDVDDHFKTSLKLIVGCK